MKRHRNPSDDDPCQSVSQFFYFLLSFFSLVDASKVVRSPGKDIEGGIDEGFSVQTSDFFASSQCEMKEEEKERQAYRHKEKRKEDVSIVQKGSE